MTSHRTIKWIESLADQELSIRSGDRSSIDLCTTKDEVLCVESATFLRDVYYHVDYLVRLFNLRIVEQDLQLKLTQKSEASEGFHVARGSMRLQLVCPKPGVIHFSCEKRVDGSSRPSVMFSGTLEAEFGLFHEVNWTFLGNHVGPEQIARHCLTEFIQVSSP